MTIAPSKHCTIGLPDQNTLSYRENRLAASASMKVVYRAALQADLRAALERERKQREETEQAWAERERMTTQPASDVLLSTTTTPTKKLRSCRQTTRPKSVKPEAKRFLTKEESKLLKNRTLPTTVADWKSIRLSRRQRGWLRKARQAKSQPSSKQRSVILALAN